MAANDYTQELRRLERGVRLAWAANFIILALTIEAAAYFILPFIVVDADPVTTLVMAAPVAIIGSLACVAYVSMRSSRMLLAAAGANLMPQDHGVVFDVAEEMAVAAGRPAPEVYVDVGSGVANAYAVSDGKGHDRVIVTKELLAMVDREELQGVIGHEVGHLASGDSAAMTKLVALTSIVGILSAGVARGVAWGGGRRDRDDDSPLGGIIGLLAFVFLLIAPLLSRIAQSAMSRTRESHADAESVRLTRNPTALARALVALEGNAKRVDGGLSGRFQSTAGALAFWSPAVGSTHPSTESRVKALVSMGADPSLLKAIGKGE